MDKSSAHNRFSRQDIITLQVGSSDSRFEIEAGVLCSHSDFFNAMLFGPAASSMQTCELTVSGAIFVQADPTTFKHIIDFCLFECYPLFWENGHFQLGLYAQLLHQARYYQVEKLADWIQCKGFERAVTIKIVHEKHTLDDDRDSFKGEKCSGLVDKLINVGKEKEQKWQCPQGNSNHQGPSKAGGGHNICGRYCDKAGEGKYEEVEMQVLHVVTKTTMVNWDALICTK